MCFLSILICRHDCRRHVMISNHLTRLTGQVAAVVIWHRCFVATQLSAKISKYMEMTTVSSKLCGRRQLAVGLLHYAAEVEAFP